MVSPCGDDYFSSGKFAMPQNRYALCGVTFAKGEGRRCRFFTPILLCDKAQLLHAFFIKSAPSRLTPNEALPHTPLRALP